MPVDIDSPEGHIIRKMVPFSTMPNSIFKVICGKIVLETARSGTFLFKRGDVNKELVYLLKGEVSLEVDKLKMEVIKAGTESARFALAHQIPRKVNGVAKGSVQLLRLNSIYITTPDLNAVKKPDAATTPMLKENGKKDGQSWISTLLMIPTLRALSPAQLSTINEKLSEVKLQEGEVVVKQGDIGEYFYLVKSGECLLSYKDANPQQSLTVTKLKMWDSFGAEALICEAIRNHTVTALSELSLLRINKENFLSLIKQPSLKFVDETKMQALLDNGGILLDVRPDAQYEKSHWEQAINTPLQGLRNHLKNMNKDLPVVVVSDDVKLSEAAAFLLLSCKFSAYVSRKMIEPVSSELVINLRNPATHADVTEAGVLNDEILFDVELMPAEQMLIKTRSVPEHAAMPDLSTAESANLRQQLKEWKFRAEKAELEKQELTEKYQLLLKQSERLKALLESLTKYNGMI
jgi:CRP-like cAMP-binding protein